MAQALGLLAVTSGLAHAALIADAALKNATVRLVDMETDTLGGFVCKFVGDAGAALAAVSGGKEMGVEIGAEMSGYVNPAYDSAAEAQWITTPEVWHGLLGSRVSLIPSEEQRPSLALGFLETRGAVGAIAAIDEMCKAANVSLMGYERTGAIRVVVVIRGDVASVTTAVEVGGKIAERVGDLVAVRTIASPHPAIASLWPAQPPTQ